MIKVFIVGGDLQIEKMYNEMGGFMIVHTPEEADILQFTGGADVSPHLYKENNHPLTSISPGRDEREINIFNQWTGKRGMVGICRGGQLLNVLNFGKMWQHVDGHTHEHLIRDRVFGQIVHVTSTHHQMMRPHTSGLIVATAKESSFKERMSFNQIVKEENPLQDIEVVWYKHSKCLCFQPHPEFYDGDCRRYFFRLLAKFF